MLDRDLAELFDVKAIRLREQLKRNIEKFPPHFMFQLTNEEVEIMVSQNAIPSKQHLGGSLLYSSNLKNSPTKQNPRLLLLSRTTRGGNALKRIKKHLDNDKDNSQDINPKSQPGNAVLVTRQEPESPHHPTECDHEPLEIGQGSSGGTSLCRA